MTILSQFINDATSDQTLLCPVVITDNVQVFINKLDFMLNSLPQRPFLDYVEQHIKYSVDVLASVDSSNNIIANISYPMDGTTLDSLLHIPGVYAMQDINLTDTYIGAANDLNTRFKLHLDGFIHSYDVHKFHVILMKHGVENLTYSPIYSTEDFFTTATSFFESQSYQLSTGEKGILKAFTQFLPPLLEQSLLLHFDTINVGKSVVFDYLDWDPASLTHYFTPIDDIQQAVEVRSESRGKLYYIADSFTDLANKLGCNLPKIRRYLNCATGFSTTLLLGRVTLNLVGHKLLPLLKLHLPLTELSGYVVWALYPDKKRFLGPFTSYREAYSKLSPVAHHRQSGEERYQAVDDFKRYRNKEHLVTTEKGQFYIAVNPIRQPSGARTISRLPKYPWPQH